MTLRARIATLEAEKARLLAALLTAIAPRGETPPRRKRRRAKRAVAHVAETEGDQVVAVAKKPFVHLSVAAVDRASGTVYLETARSRPKLLPTVAMLPGENPGGGSAAKPQRRDPSETATVGAFPVPPREPVQGPMPDERPRGFAPNGLERRLSKLERAELVEYPADVDRPRTRGECADWPRPCPFVSCRYHLFLDVNPSGTIKLNFPSLAPDQMTESCCLDVADRGELTLERVGDILALTRERVRQVEEKATRRAAGELEPWRAA